MFARNTLFFCLAVAAAQADNAQDWGAGPSLTGFYIMESNENLVEMIMADMNITRAAAEDIGSYIDSRITEEDGVYKLVDTYGNGFKREMCFKLGQEFEEPSSSSPTIAARTGPGEVKFITKSSSGKAQVWSAAFTNDGVTWTKETGEGCSITYKRQPACSSPSSKQTTDVMLPGYYVLEKSENLIEMLMAEMQVDAAEAAKFASFVAVRVLPHKGDGTIDYIDYYGPEFQYQASFKLGQKSVDETYGVELLATRTGPGKMTISMSSGAEWEADFNESGMTWTQKTGAKAKLTYRRYPDFSGSWKVVSSRGEALFRKLGLPEQMIKMMLNEKYTETITFKGNGVWEWKTDSKVNPHPPVCFRIGEENELDMAGIKMHSLYVLNKSALIISTRMPNGVTTVYTSTANDNFLVQTGRLVGSEETGTTIMMRVDSP